MDDDREELVTDNPVSRPEGGGSSGKASGRGVAHRWWADRWLRALTQWIDVARLAQGRQDAQAGRVSDLHLAPGLITARVQGSRLEPHDVRIEMATFDEGEWERILKALSERALYAAQLLNGELPRSIDTVLSLTLGEGRSLFPDEGADIRAVCSCADRVKPCKHVAAALVLAGEMLDRDPFLLLTLRGRAPKEVLEALRKQRLHIETKPNTGTPVGHEASANSAEKEPLSERVADFWEVGPEAEEIHVRVAPAEIELEVLRILGEMELEADKSLMERLERVYKAVSQRAMEIAFGEQRPHDDAES
jgi:uncharacterized Zn finger protein